MTRLVLVRHGESVAQVERFIGGHESCRGLSDRGRAQVTALRDRLQRTQELEADVVVTSVLPRAIETAQMIGPAVGGGEPIQDCDLCEIHVGEADGLTWEEFEQRYPRTDFFADEAPAPGMESVRQFTDRVSRALKRYAEEHEGKTIVAAVHGGIVESSLTTFFGLEGRAPVGEIVNASITEWSFEANPFTVDRTPRWALVRWNDHAHLAGTDLR